MQRPASTGRSVLSIGVGYDKRGTGKSGGERWPRTTGSFVDLADDAIAGARFLGRQTFVDAGRIGAWGLSQGAWVGPLAAARAPTLLRFAVMISGGGVSPAEQELYDDEVKLRAAGFGTAEIDDALAYLRLADQYVRTQGDEDWNRFELARDAARVSSALGRAAERRLTVRVYPDADHALMVKPARASTWVAERPAVDWVHDMIEWARALWE